jgi:hypothetical protein
MLLGPSIFYSICSIKGILVEILVVLNFFMFVSVHWRAAEGRKELKKIRWMGRNLMRLLPMLLLLVSIGR